MLRGAAGARDGDEAVRYPIENGCVERYPNTPHGLSRMTNKGIEALLSNP